MTNETWQDIVPGTLIVFREGKQVFPINEENLDGKILHALYKIRTSPHRVGVFAIANTVGMKPDEAHKVLQPYICFNTDIDKTDPPLNFDWDRGKSNRILRMIPYNKAMGITGKKCSRQSAKKL